MNCLVSFATLKKARRYRPLRHEMRSEKSEATTTAAAALCAVRSVCPITVRQRASDASIPRGLEMVCVRGACGAVCLRRVACSHAPESPRHTVRAYRKKKNSLVLASLTRSFCFLVSAPEKEQHTKHPADTRATDTANSYSLAVSLGLSPTGSR